MVVFFIDCDNRQPRNQTEYENLLRTHADIYPTGKEFLYFLTHSLQVVKVPAVYTCSVQVNIYESCGVFVIFVLCTSLF